MSKPADVGTWERVRRVRYGAVLKLVRHRYGPVIPDDDSGRPDLWELMQLTSLGQADADKKMRHILETMTKLTDSEAEVYIDHLNRVPMYQRLRTPRALGNALMMTNAEREVLNLRPILPHDLTDEQLKERNKVKKRQREAQRRLRKGGRTREQYLADLRNRARPWEPIGITQRAWQKRQQQSSRGSCLRFARSVPRNTSLTEAATKRTEATAKKGEIPMPRQASNDKQAERQSHDDRLPKTRTPRTAAELKDLKIAWAERWRGQLHHATYEAAVAAVKRLH